MLEKTYNSNSHAQQNSIAILDVSKTAIEFIQQLQPIGESILASIYHFSTYSQEEVLDSHVDKTNIDES